MAQTALSIALAWTTLSACGAARQVAERAVHRDYAAREMSRCRTDENSALTVQMHRVTSGAAEWDQSLYERAIEHARQLDAIGCWDAAKARVTATGTSLNEELGTMRAIVDRHRKQKAYQQEQKARIEREERERQEAEERARREELARERQREAQQALEEHRRVVEAKAKKAGLRGVVYGEGIYRAVEALRRGEVSLRDIQHAAIELHDDDDADFTAIQILNRENALFISDDASIVILLRKTGDQLFEGASLLSIRNHYVVIKDVVEYDTPLGSRQAFVVEMAW